MPIFSRHRALPGVLAGGVPLLLTACQSATSAPSTSEAGEGIDCAIGAAAQMTRGCTVERTASADGDLILVVHHPDGGFRRLMITRDGRGVVAADGASPVTVTPIDGHEIDVAVDQDRYHLPATVRGTPAP